MQIIKNYQIHLQSLSRINQYKELYAPAIQSFNIGEDYYSIKIVKLHLDIKEDCKDWGYSNKLSEYSDVFTCEDEAGKFITNKINKMFEYEIEEILIKKTRLLNKQPFKIINETIKKL